MSTFWQHIKRPVKWIFGNGIAVAVMYDAFFLHSTGAQNLILFYVWIAFIFSIIVNFELSIKALASRNDLPGRIWMGFDFMFDMAIVAIFAWQGWFVTAVVYMLHVFLLNAAITRAKEKVFSILEKSEVAP